jgi:tetratricopeptide (TPR) repeat protein
MDISEQINKLEEKAINFKNAKKYFESLKKYEEVIQLKKETYGERNESTIRTSSEAAIVCNILSMSFLQKGNYCLLIKPLENYAVALELLKKAEAFTDEGDRYRAVTYNNFACIFRRTKKLRSALSYLEKALEIEYNYLHFSQ